MDTDDYHRSYLLRLVLKKLEHNHFPDHIVSLDLTVGTLRWLRDYLEKADGKNKVDDRRREREAKE